jgi:predicted small lipoprotein YifL
MLALALLLAACGDYRPMAMPDAREDPPIDGLFSGSQREWVIFRKGD